MKRCAVWVLRLPPGARAAAFKTDARPVCVMPPAAAKADATPSAIRRDILMINPDRNACYIFIHGSYQGLPAYATLSAQRCWLRLSFKFHRGTSRHDPRRTPRLNLRGFRNFTEWCELSFNRRCIGLNSINWQLSACETGMRTDRCGRGSLARRRLHRACPPDCAKSRARRSAILGAARGRRERFIMNSGVDLSVALGSYRQTSAWRIKCPTKI